MCETMREERDSVSRALWQTMLTAPCDDEQSRAREELFRLHESLAMSFGRPYMKFRGLTPEDVCQCCRIAVIQAMDRWDPDRGPLSVLIAYWVAKEIKQWMRWEQVYRSGGSEVSDPEEEEETRNHGQLRRKCELSFFSLDYVFAQCGDNDPLNDYTDAMIEQSVPSHEETLVPTLCIESALAALTPENRELVEIRYGFNGEIPHTYDEIASSISPGMSRQAVFHRLKRIQQQMVSHLDGF